MSDKVESTAQDLDVILKSDDSETTLAVKQSTLTKESQYFKLRGSFDCVNSKVEFSSKIIPFITLELIVKFLEHGKLTPSEDTLEQLFIAADFLKMNKMLTMLYDHLLAELIAQEPSSVDKPTLVMLLRLSQILNRYELSTKREPTPVAWVYTPTSKVANWTIVLLDFVVVNFSKVRHCHEINELPFDIFRRIMSDRALNISEEEVLGSIKMWINVDFENRQKYFHSLLECVWYNESVELDFIMDELVCSCHILHCKCLSSLEYVVAFLTQRHKCYRPKVFPLKTEKRLTGTFKNAPKKAEN